MEARFKIIAFTIGGMIAIATSLYLSSVIYFQLNGWNPDRAMPWSILQFITLTQKPYGLYLAISLIAPNALLAGMVIFLLLKPEDTNTHWATRHDMQKAGLLKKTGILLGLHQGKFLYNDDPTHVFVIAPTRSGKGVGIVIPNLLTWRESFICLDVKGENHRITSGNVKRYGYKVINFDPFSKDEKSHCYNPLDYVSKKFTRRVTDVQKIANILITSYPKGDPHFPNEARDLFLGLALYVIDHEDHPSTIGAIARLLGTEHEFGELLKHIAQTYPQLDETAKQLFNSFSAKAEKERSGIKSTLGTALQLWRNAEIDAATAKSDFYFQDLRKSLHAVYLGASVSDMKTLAPLMRIFFEQAITELTAHEPDPVKEPHKLLMIMDEFHILGNMDIMAGAFTLLAGFNVRIMGIIQNIGLLDQVYDRHTRETILSNCAHQIFFATQNAETQKYVSQACGETTIKSQSISKASGFSTEKARVSISEKTVPLIKPHQVNHLKQKQIILIENSFPVKCKKIIYHKMKCFKPMLLPPAPTPDLEITQQSAPKFEILKQNISANNKPRKTMASIEPKADLNNLQEVG